MIPLKTPVRHPYSDNRNVNITIPISREWQGITRLLPVLLAEHLSVKDSGALHWIPRIHASRVSLQFLDLMQDIIWIDIDCSVKKVVGYVWDLPLLVGLGLVKLITSELWFGPSESSLTKFLGLQNNLLLIPGLAGNFRQRGRDRVYMICRMEFNGCTHFHLLHSKVAIQKLTLKNSWYKKESKPWITSTNSWL
jgi:hypothetical protein